MRTLGVQIVGYERDPDAPALVFAENGDVSRKSLTPGLELDYGLDVRHCAGSIENGRHVPCSAPDAPYCETHARVWRPTITDEEHAIYLAAFAPETFKVGVTRLWRLDRRLREQGADRAAHVATVPDGRIAREREAEIADSIDGSDRVRIREKIDGIDRNVDRDAWERLLAGFEVTERSAFEYGLDLSTRPIAARLARGTVRGVKGRLLVLAVGETTYAVDLRDLVGYELVANGGDRQSSLAGFR